MALHIPPIGDPLTKIFTSIIQFVNYPETKDFWASWADQSNLQSYLHTL